MAEAVALGASIIAIIQISGQIIGLCKHYVESVQDAPRDLHVIFLEISTLRAIFEGLGLLYNPHKPLSPNLQSLAGDHGPVEGCRRTVSDLERLLGPETDAAAQGKRRKIKTTLKSLAWPLKEAKAKKLLDHVLRYKTMITLALSSESTHDIKRVDHKVDLLRATDMNEERQAILDWLTPIDYASQQSDFIARHQGGTGQSFLGSTEFQEWLKIDQKTMFCPGIPGAGKTIITAIVINDLLSRFHTDPSVGIAWLYCNFRQQDEQKVENLFASLLKQLCHQQSSLPNSLRDLYKLHKNTRTRPSLDEILRVLYSVVATYSRVFIIVDALDECQVFDGSRRRFLSDIFNIQANCGTNLFATSRFILEITEMFKGSIQKEIRASKGDIQRYLEGSMVRLPRCVVQNIELQEEVKTKIVEAVDGMFLLAQLHLDSLIGRRSPKAVRKALDSLVTGSDAYDNAYRDAMGRIEGQARESSRLAKEVLSWITCAKRSLSTLELQHALAVEIGETELDQENLPDIKDIISVCAGLVTVDRESNVIRLVHYTTQEYFQRNWMSWFSEAHLDIANICIAYLSFDAFEAGTCQSYQQFRERSKVNVLYDYAVRNWGHHAYNINTTSAEFVKSSLIFLQQEVKVSSSCQAIMAARPYVPKAQKPPGNMTCVHLAAWFGLTEIMVALLEKGYDPNARDPFGRTPLFYATDNEHATVIKLLVESGADTTAKDNNGCTILHLAVIRRHETVVHMLLENGSDVEAKATIYEHEAFSNAYQFLEEQLGYATKDRARCTPLHWAAAKGLRAVVKLLLDHGASISSKTGVSVVKAAGGQTPLHLSAGRGHLDVSELLLQEGADIAARDSAGRMALHYVARDGHESLVRLLLEKGNEVDEEDWDGCTALHKAVQGGHYEVARLLIEKGANIEAETKQGWGGTALYMAASHNAIVRLLIEKKVDVNRKISSGTALHRMAQLGNVESIRLMLENGADIEEEEKRGNRKALHIAAGNLRTEAVRLLLERGADIHARDSEGRSALHCVVEVLGEGNEKLPLVRLLLERGADVDAKDNEGKTALDKAWEIRYWDEPQWVVVSRLLLEKGTTIRAKNDIGRIPIRPSNS